MSGVTEVMHPRLELPPGFRFHPTDEELATHYLTPKVLDPSFSCLVIADVNLNECEPSDLPGMAKMGEKEWYFFVNKGRRYPTGTRINRATKSGYWKATGRDKEIFRGKGRDAVLVGMKKTLVFYTGSAPRGGKTPWVMHEYRLDGKLPANMPRSAKDQWAVCRVINKDLVVKNAPKMAPAAGGMEPIDFVDNDWLCTGGMPPLMDSPFGNDDDFTTGASSSTSGAVVMPEQDMGFYEVKTEQPAPPQEMQSPDYFSLPATSYYQGNQQDAIRRHSRPAAPSPSALPVPLLGAETEMPSLMPSPYLELDDFSSDPLDYFLSSW